MNYVEHILIMIGIYLPLAYALNLPMGFGGLISFCHAAFYGLGAYAYALLVTKAGFPTLAALFGAVSLAAFLAAIIGIIALKFRGDLFLFVTLGFQMVIFIILYNWVDVTNGPYGVTGIPRPDIFGGRVASPLDFLILALAMNAILLPALFAVYRSPFGLTLKAVRENEAAAESLGVDAQRILFQAFVAAAAVAAIPGAFYAAYITYLDPTSFGLNESIFLVSILFLGGSGNKSGPFLGVLIMVLLPEGLRFVGMREDIAYNIREIIYGMLLIALMYWRPQGIAGEFEVR